MNNPISRVAIIGGTHGNELTGTHLIRRWTTNPTEVCRPSFSTDLFIGNPKATMMNRRFVDEDLNRCFALDTLADLGSSSYEVARAAQLNAVLGPKGAAKYDFVIDLHTSTTHCGAMIIIIDDSSFNIRLAAYIQTRIPAARIFYLPPSSGDQPYLGSICKRSLAVEVGPIPQGLLNYDVFALSAAITIHAIDYTHFSNTGDTPSLPSSVEVFRFSETVAFPRSGDCFDAIVHESLQSKDYEPLLPGAPLFRTLQGEVIPYTGANTVYPVFVNEAAYYYKGIAMSLTTKERYEL